MTEIRAVRADDLDALYRIALATGDGGADAAALYRDPRLLGHIYAAPYAVLCPAAVFVAWDAAGVAGYIVGTADTVSYEARLEAEWWPMLRPLYPDPISVPPQARTLDQRRAVTIHHPSRTPAALTTRYPAHLHINLLPRLRGQGIGQALMDRWLTAMRQCGATGAHLAVGIISTRAIRFYEACGFVEPPDIPPPASNARWYVRAI